jgi:hypothetical protein
MRYKNQADRVALWVDIETPDGKQLRVNGTSIAQLITLVEIQLTAFNDQGYDYLAPIDKQAAAIGQTRRGFLAIAIENIMCKREPNPEEKCFSDGPGDNLTILSGKIDKIVAGLPKTLGVVAKAAIRAATKVATGKASNQLSTCSICSGTRDITPKKRILGRAGYINSYRGLRQGTKQG